MKFKLTRDDIKLILDFVFTVVMMVWAYNIGQHVALETLTYVNSVCGPGSAELNGNTLTIYAVPPGCYVNKATGIVECMSDEINPLLMDINNGSIIISDELNRDDNKIN